MFFEFFIKTFNLLFFIKTNFTSVNNSVARIIRHHAQLTAPRVHESTEPVGTEAETLENVSALILFYSHLMCEHVRADQEWRHLSLSAVSRHVEPQTCGALVSLFCCFCSAWAKLPQLHMSSAWTCREQRESWGTSGGAPGSGGSDTNWVCSQLILKSSRNTDVIKQRHCLFSSSL